MSGRKEILTVIVTIKLNDTSTHNNSNYYDLVRDLEREIKQNEEKVDELKNSLRRKRIDSIRLRMRKNKFKLRLKYYSKQKKPLRWLKVVK